MATSDTARILPPPRAQTIIPARTKASDVMELTGWPRRPPTTSSQSFSAPTGEKYGPVNVSRKPNDSSRKTMWRSTCQPRGCGLLFRPRRRGNLTTATDTAGNRRTGRTGEPACRQEGQPDDGGKLPAKGSVGDRTGILRDRRAVEDHGRSRDLPRRTERSAPGGSRGRPGGQVARPTPVILTNHIAVGLVSLRPRTELGPRPDTERD